MDQCAPEQMLLDNRQLVAANHDAVVVLQLVKEVWIDVGSGSSVGQ
jgi:hypothetical protein